MKIVLRGGESHLLKQLEAGRASSHRMAWHVDTLGLLEHHQLPEKQAILLNIVRDRLRDAEGVLYCCDDGDLFALGPLASKPAIDALAREMRFLMPDDPIVTSDRFIRGYDLTRTLPQVQSLCRQKKVTPSEQPAPAVGNDPVGFQQEIFFHGLQRRKRRRSPLLMIVEDQSFSRQLLMYALGKQYETISAKNGLEALDLYAAHAPDVTFLDIGLPGVDGQQVLDQIARHDPNPFVVMLTATADKGNIERARKNGVKGYISKPFTQQKIAAYMETYLAGAPHHQAAEAPR